MLWLALAIFFSRPFNVQASDTFNWEGTSSSVATRAMSGAGLTNPLTETLMPWASSKSVDESWISENSALASRLVEGPGRLEPGVMRLESGGVFGPFEASTPEYSDLSALRTAMASKPNVPSVSRVDLVARYFEKGLAASFAFVRKRSAILDDAGGIDFRSYRDFVGSLAASGPVFEKENAGRLEFGTGVKAIYRSGDEAYFSSDSAAGQSLLPSVFIKKTYAAGLDYGLLYSAPKKWTKKYLLQVALTWKDVGSTQFFVGQSTSTGRRFDALPNNQSFGVGVGTPNIWRGFGGALRVEYREWKRQVSFLHKTIVAAELRAPEVVSLYAGARGNLWSVGASFRFPYVELSFASYAEDFGENGGERTGRGISLEMKSVF